MDTSQDRAAKALLTKCIGAGLIFGWLTGHLLLGPLLGGVVGGLLIVSGVAGASSSIPRK